MDATDDLAPPAKPRKPSIFRVVQNALIEENEIEPPKPQKPRALQGKDYVPPTSTTKVGGLMSNLRAWIPKPGKKTDRSEILAMVGPSAGPSCLTVPFAREEETTETYHEKYIVYVVELKLENCRKSICTHRFSDFVEFHAEWKNDYPGLNIELPKKLMSVRDEDISRRCLEFQVYLRQVLEVSALLYYAARFLQCSEDDLRATLRASNNPSPSEAPDRSATPKGHQVNRPKINLNGETVSAPAEESISSQAGSAVVSFASAVTSFFTTSEDTNATTETKYEEPSTIASNSTPTVAEVRKIDVDSPQATEIATAPPAKEVTSPKRESKIPTSPVKSPRNNVSTGQKQFPTAQNTLHSSSKTWSGTTSPKTVPSYTVGKSSAPANVKISTPTNLKASAPANVKNPTTTTVKSPILATKTAVPASLKGTTTANVKLSPPAKAVQPAGASSVKDRMAMFEKKN